MNWNEIPAWLGGGAVTLVLGLFGFQTWKAKASQTRLGEAVDSKQKEFLGIGLEQYRSLEKQFATMEERCNNAMKDVRRLEDELAKAQRDGLQLQIRMDAAIESAREWEKRSERGAAMLTREQIAGMFVQSQFLEDVELRKTPPRAPLPPPADPYQANVVIGGRRATDPPFEFRPVRKDEP